MSVEPEVEVVYNKFWREIVERPDGTLDIDQIKRELYDYRDLLHEVPKVYMEITNGVISKPNTTASAVLQLHSERCPLV